MRTVLKRRAMYDASDLIFLSLFANCYQNTLLKLLHPTGIRKKFSF